MQDLFQALLSGSYNQCEFREECFIYCMFENMINKLLFSEGVNKANIIGVPKILFKSFYFKISSLIQHVTC